MSDKIPRVLKRTIRYAGPMPTEILILLNQVTSKFGRVIEFKKDGIHRVGYIMMQQKPNKYWVIPR